MQRHVVSVKKRKRSRIPQTNFSTDQIEDDPMQSRTSRPFQSAYDETRSEIERGADNAKDAAERGIESGKDTVQSASEKVSNLASRVGDSAGEMAEQAKETASEMAERGADYARSASRQVRTYASELEGIGRRNPLATLAAAIFVGVAIGYLARGRDR
jgi:hypothetical protein